MQSFAITLQMSLKAVITETFLQEARAEAKAADASLFLRTMQEKFPDDDDQFMLAVVKNAMRSTIRHGTLAFMSGSGVGGSVSPVQIVEESIIQPKADVQNFAEATEGGPVKRRPEGKAYAVAIDKYQEDVLPLGVETFQ